MRCVVGNPVTLLNPAIPMKQRSRVKTVALGFHEVTDDPTSSGFQRRGASPYKHATAAFARYLDETLTGRCAPALITEIDVTQPGKYLLLTFDDGGKSAVYASAYLCTRRLRGHFFVVKSLIDRSHFLNRADVR